MKIRVFLFCLTGAVSLQGQTDSLTIFEENDLDWPVTEYCHHTDYIQRYLDQELRYPKEALESGIEGLVIFSFVLDAQGRQSDPTILQDPGGGCGAAVLKKMPPARYWFRPRRNGQGVSVRLVRYILFRLADTSVTYFIRHPAMNGPLTTPLEWERENKVYEMFDLSKPSTFPGGEKELLRFFRESLQLDACPSDSRINRTTAVVSFVVNKKGLIYDIRLVKIPHPCLADPLIAAIRRMPPLIPAEANGCPVQMRMLLPVRIRLE